MPQISTPRSSKERLIIVGKDRVKTHLRGAEILAGLPVVEHPFMIWPHDMQVYLLAHLKPGTMRLETKMGANMRDVHDVLREGFQSVDGYPFEDYLGRVEGTLLSGRLDETGNQTWSYDHPLYGIPFFLNCAMSKGAEGLDTVSWLISRANIPVSGRVRRIL